jgi:hypothetical protein
MMVAYVDLTLHAKDSASFEFSLWPFWFSVLAFEIFQLKRCRPTRVHLIGTCPAISQFLLDGRVDFCLYFYFILV